MTARYRLVQFVANPFAGAAMPIAALLEREGEVHLIPGRAPGAGCLGSVRSSRLVSLLMRELRYAQFESLPISVGPQAILSEIRPVPSGVRDPDKWIANVILARHPEQGELENTQVRGQRLASQGFRFFENYGVARYVRKRYVPEPSSALKDAHSISNVSHYVRGRNRLLLMEPLSPLRESWRSDVRDIAEMFGAYQYLLAQTRKSASTTLWAYILAGGTRAERAELRSAIEPFADRIADTTDGPSRSEFLQQIREVGRSNESETYLV